MTFIPCFNNSKYGKGVKKFVTFYLLICRDEMRLVDFMGNKFVVEIILLSYIPVIRDNNCPLILECFCD
jgi:hypothetical protein